MTRVRVVGRLLTMLGLAVLLAACAAPARIGGQGPAFERVGRFAVNLQPVAQPPYAAQGGFSWRDDGRTLQLDLSNPLGSVLARIRVDAGVSVLERADGSRESAPSPDALLAQVWGHPMPVAGLRYWVRGQLEPGQAASGVQHDEQGRLTALQQHGWDVRLSAYDDDQGPLRVRLSRQDDQGQWRLQLVMDRP
ncbi:lipoprotein insertase outer membrane protein LolB [Castellaniella sp.]|uniref:lipoprotein insertase outer membrane protein LolB n=1 Tax=Castellaniella sp. TaxID=1955812 RepID=UPI002AFF6434|nr:lipoprotein insertase outer membrane protein LolB [Castellaniella sp.]